MMSDAGRAFVVRVDKPVGPTSHDVVAMARRALHTRRVGHTGTLDPFASGLLLLCVNQATRIAEFLTGLDKTYVATARLDAFTTTDDYTGAIIEDHNTWPRLGRAEVEAAMRSLTGEIEQIPPQYSARKVGGERGYRRARRGETVDLAPARVHVRRFELLGLDLPEVRFSVECSSGTYIRALARDLGRTLGVGGYLTVLRRTRIGTFPVDGAVPVNQLHDPAALTAASCSPLDAIAHLPRVEVAEESVIRLMHGQALPLSNPGEREVVAVTSGDRLIAMAREDGTWLRPFKVLGGTGD